MNEVWALIQNGFIVNVIEAQSVDPEYICVNITNYNPQPGVGWATSDNISFSPPVVVIPLSAAIQQNLLVFQSSLQAYVDNAYSLETRFNFNALYILASQQNLTNRMAYITQLFTWAQSIVSYAAAYTASVMAMNSVSELESTQFDPTQFLPDPLITPIHAIGITN